MISEGVPVQEVFRIRKAELKTDEKKRYITKGGNLFIDYENDTKKWSGEEDLGKNEIAFLGMGLSSIRKITGSPSLDPFFLEGEGDLFEKVMEEENMTMTGGIRSINKDYVELSGSLTTAPSKIKVDDSELKENFKYDVFFQSSIYCKANGFGNFG